MLKELAKCRDAGSNPGCSDDTRSGVSIEIDIVGGRGVRDPPASTPEFYRSTAVKWEPASVAQLCSCWPLGEMGPALFDVSS